MDNNAEAAVLTASIKHTPAGRGQALGADRRRPAFGGFVAYRVAAGTLLTPPAAAI